MPVSIGNFAGAVVETGTSAITAQNFSAILALEDTVFASLVAGDWTGDSLASLPLPKGVTIYGHFTAFTLTSGKVIAYKSPYN